MEKNELDGLSLEEAWDKYLGKRAVVVSVDEEEEDRWIGHIGTIVKVSHGAYGQYLVEFDNLAPYEAVFSLEEIELIGDNNEELR